MDYCHKEIKSKIIIRSSELMMFNKRRNTHFSSSLSSITGLRRTGGFGIKAVNAKRSRSVAFSETRSVRSRKNSKVSFGGKSRNRSIKEVKQNVPMALILSPKSTERTQQRDLQQASLDRIFALFPDAVQEPHPLILLRNVPAWFFFQVGDRITATT